MSMKQVGGWLFFVAVCSSTGGVYFHTGGDLGLASEMLAIESFVLGIIFWRTK